MVVKGLLWLLLALGLCACTPQAALLASLIPQGMFTTALGNLEKVSDENRRRVSELAQAGRWEDLERFSAQNIEKDPRNADWWLIRGYARSRLGRHADASLAYAEAVRIEPDAAEAWNLLAQSYRAAGDSQRAVSVLNNALLALRDAPVTAFLLGESYGDLKRYEDAAGAYRQALAMNADFPEAWLALSRTYSALGRSEDAKEARARLEKLDPQLSRRANDADAARRP